MNPSIPSNGESDFPIREEIHSMDSDLKSQMAIFLSQIEKERHLKIIFASETGSRGQGFNTKDSDCDVKGFYTYSFDQYLSTIDLPTSYLSEEHTIIVCGKTISVDLSLVEFREFVVKRLNEDEEKLNLTLLSNVQYINKFQEEQYNKLVYQTLITPFNATLSDLGTFITKRLQKEEVECRKILNILHCLLALIHFSNSDSFMHYSYDIWTEIQMNSFIDGRSKKQFLDLATMALERKNHSRKATIKKKLLPPWFMQMINIYANMNKNITRCSEKKEFRQLAQKIHEDLMMLDC